MPRRALMCLAGGGHSQRRRDDRELPTASETNPVRIPGHKDWAWAGGGHSQRRSSRCGRFARAKSRSVPRCGGCCTRVHAFTVHAFTFTVHAFTVHAFTVHAFTVHAFTVHAFTVYIHAFTVHAFTVHAFTFTVHAFTVHAFTVHAFTVHAFTVQGDEFNEIHGEKFTASEELCPRDQRQIRPRKVPYVASPAATASETNPVRIPGHKDWTWAGGGHSQRRSSRCHRVRAAMSSGPAADSPARSPVASPAAVAVARKRVYTRLQYTRLQFTVHAFTVHAFTVHAFTVHAFIVHAFTHTRLQHTRLQFTVHAFTVHAFTVHAFTFTVHAFTVHAFTVHAFTVHAFTVQGDEFNEIHGEKFTASEELCPRDQQQIRPRKVPYVASPAATASETNPVRIPGHKDWTWAGGGHSQRRSSRWSVYQAKTRAPPFNTR
ncbi:hypothetical protein Bbelb_022680 [Branchiostoma belcheri]|nr:hypothetical protein Bbelb_022680 [Branchiostoma belcheri]